jgi:hypothetical protein
LIDTTPEKSGTIKIYFYYSFKDTMTSETAVTSLPDVEAIRDIFGAETKIAGFYSYGELSPFREGGECRLHNQTMTITALAEA